MNQSILLPSVHKVGLYLSEPGTTSFTNEKVQPGPSVRRQAWPFLTSHEQILAAGIAQPRLDLKSFVT